MAPSIIVATPDDFALTAAQTIAGQIAGSLAVRGTCAIALCGGSTPEPVYRQLIDSNIRWPGVSVYFGDERAVPPDHADSNYGMAWRALLAHVSIPDGQLHRMEAERADRNVAAAEYDRLLPVRLDVLLLGIGPDGHTASLFPEQPSLHESAHRVIPVGPPPPPLQPQVRRMTITPPVIAAARQVVVLVTGASKATVVARTLQGPEQADHLPAQLARSGTWVLDTDAAGKLQQGER